MSLSPCNTIVDSQGRELVEHGTTAFPIACYYDDLGREEVPWHWHDELEAAVIIEGHAVVAVGNEKYTVHAGEGFFINGGILHGCWDLDGSCSKFHSMVFHPRLVGGSMDSIFYQKYVQPLIDHRGLEGMIFTPAVSWQAEALAHIESAWQACAKETAGFEFQVRSALSAIVFLLQNHIPALMPCPGNKTRRDGRRMKQMLQLIHDGFAEELSTAQIAEQAAISESECLRCFKSTIGITPIQYVRQYRIQRACLLLTTTQEHISDIALQCGFQDVSYFTKTFREMKGMVPSEYRKVNTM